MKLLWVLRSDQHMSIIDVYEFYQLPKTSQVTSALPEDGQLHMLTLAVPGLGSVGVKDRQGTLAFARIRTIIASLFEHEFTRGLEGHIYIIQSLGQVSRPFFRRRVVKAKTFAASEQNFTKDSDGIWPRTVLPSYPAIVQLAL